LSLSKRLINLTRK